MLRNILLTLTNQHKTILMKIFFSLALIVISFNTMAHRGEYLSIEQVEISNSETGKITYSFKIENITNTPFENVQIDFLKNGKSIQSHFFLYISCT